MRKIQKEIAIRFPALSTVSLLLAVFVTDGHAQSSLSTYAGADLASMSGTPRVPAATLRDYGVPTARADDAAADDGWHFTITPLLWCAGVDAKVRIKNVSTSASPSFNDLLQNLDLGGMLHLEAEKGRWLLFSDIVYMDLRVDNASGPLGLASIDIRFQEYIGSLNAGYRIVDVPVDPAHPDGARLQVDGYAGVRYTWFKSTINPFNGPTLSNSVDIWDPLIGVRTRLVVTPKVNIVGRYDYGGWSVGCARTWFLFGGVEWRAFDSVAIGAGYAALYQDYYGSGNFHLEETMQGPLVSLSFRF